MNKTHSRVLFEDQYYVVCLISIGISVQSKPSGKGKVIQPSHKQYQGYYEGFTGDGYPDEKQALARILCRS